MNKRREISWVKEKIGYFEELYNNGQNQEESLDDR